jgi:hypothetical protein
MHRAQGGPVPAAGGRFGKLSYVSASCLWSSFAELYLISSATTVMPLASFKHADGLAAVAGRCAGPVRIMGVIAILMYGIMVILSTLYPDLSSMWIKAMLSIVLGAMVAAGVGILVGFLVLPSLASDEVGYTAAAAIT